MNKNRTKKQFIAETNSNLTPEECKEYYDNFSKIASVFVEVLGGTVWVVLAVVP